MPKSHEKRKGGLGRSMAEAYVYEYVRASSASGLWRHKRVQLAQHGLIDAINLNSRVGLYLGGGFFHSSQVGRSMASPEEACSHEKVTPVASRFELRVWFDVPNLAVDLATSSVDNVAKSVLTNMC